MKLITIVSIVILSVLGLFYFRSPSAPSTPTSSVPTPATPATNTNPAAAGVYTPFAQGVLEEYAVSRRVLFFYASWCPTCRPVDAELTSRAAELPEGVTVIRVNYNDPETDQVEQALAKEYGITYQHTFVQIDESGMAIKRWNGGGLAELLDNLI